MKSPNRISKAHSMFPLILAAVLSVWGCSDNRGGSATSEEVKGLREASRKQAQEAADPSIAAGRRAAAEAADPANSAECKRQNQAFMKREIDQNQMTAECRKAFGMAVGAPGGS